MFLKSVDASDKVKDGHLLFQLLDQVVEEVGVANVVQIITDNASNYVLAGKLLEEKHKTIFWTPCIAHCIDLMLEDIGKFDWVKNTIDHAKSITKFIYNHTLILSLMRKHTRGKDIIRPAITRFATQFLTLQSMLSQHRNLQKMLSSDEWNQSNWSNKPEGKELKRKVYEETFWRKAAEVVKLVEPLVKVLCLVDGERLAMGFIYEAMDQAKEQIKTVYNDRVAKYGPIWAIIDERWNNQLHRPIHAAGYFLNPRYHYKAKESGALRGEVKDGLIDCIDCMIPLESDQLEIHRQATTFSNASDPIVLEDIDPTLDWVVESRLAEFDPDEDLDLDLDIETSVDLEHAVQLNANPNPPASVSQPARTPGVAAVAQPASGTTSTAAVGDDDDEEEPWGPLFDSDDDPEIDRHDLGSSGSSY
eukprot:PITA_21949